MNENVRLNTNDFQDNYHLQIISNDNETLKEIYVNEFNDGLMVTIKNINNKYSKESLKKLCDFLFNKTNIIYMEMNSDYDKQIALDLGFEYFKNDNKCIYLLSNERYNKILSKKTKNTERVINKETNVCDNHWDGA